MIVDWTQIIVALITAGFAGVGLKLLEKIINRSKEKQSAASEIRKELRIQITDLKKEVETLKVEVDKAEAEADKWRDKYYALMDEYSKFKAEVNVLLAQAKIGFDERAKEIEQGLE